MYIVISVIISGPILAILSYRVPGDDSPIDPKEGPWSVSDALFNMFRMMVYQVCLLETPRTAPRFFLIFWFLFCLNIQGNLYD